MSIVPLWRGPVLRPDSLGLRQRASAARGLIATAVVALLAAALVAAELTWPLGIEASGLRSAIETAITLAALIGALLLRAHSQQTRQLRDLLLVVALAMVALTNFVFEALPAFDNVQTAGVTIVARLACSIILMGTLVAAAYARGGEEIPSSRSLPTTAVAVGVCIAAIGGLIGLVAGAGESTASAQAHGPVLTTLSLMSFSGLMVAGFGFARAAGDGDREAWLLAGASYLLALACLGCLANPTKLANSVTAVEPFRIVAYGLLFATAVRLYGTTRERVAQEAASAERVRIANDLHDGLAQDLAFIVSYADRLERKFGEAHQLAVAAHRALAASRGTIIGLEASQAPSTMAALREVAAELGTRFRVTITVRAATPDDPEPTAADRREIVRIAREAIVNAIRHGGARHIWVTLGSSESDLLLRVSDNGLPGGAVGRRASEGTGLGMRSMQARARTLDGELVVHPRLGGGTEIDVIVDPKARGAG
jgi:signal transduction histidine kinase